MTNIFGFLAGPLGWVMQILYSVVQNYGWAIVIFTTIFRLVMFPFHIKQQKGMAKNAAYQPMIQEIQKKWAKDKTKQNEEVMKFQQENNIKMTAGCGSMLVGMLVVFGMIAVVQQPLTHIISVPSDQVVAMTTIAEEHLSEDEAKKLVSSSKEAVLLAAVRDNPDWFIDGVDITKDGKETHVAVDQEWVEEVENFDFYFFGLDLAKSPTTNIDAYMILAILAVLTSVGFSFFSFMLNGQMGAQKQGKMSMILMMGLNVVMFAPFVFTSPVAFSLYYTVSNVLYMLQTWATKLFVKPKEIKEKIMLEIEEAKKAGKAKKKIKVVDKNGQEEEKEVTAGELAKLRLQKAREMDDARFKAEMMEVESNIGMLNEKKKEEKTTEEAEVQEKEADAVE